MDASNIPVQASDVVAALERRCAGLIKELAMTEAALAGAQRRVAELEAAQRKPLLAVDNTDPAFAQANTE